MRARLGDLKLVHKLVEYAALRTRDPDILGFFDAMLEELPEIAVEDDTMPVVFPLSQKAMNTLHCLIEIAYYSDDRDANLGMLIARAAALHTLLPPLAEISLPEIPENAETLSAIA